MFQKKCYTEILILLNPFCYKWRKILVQNSPVAIMAVYEIPLYHEFSHFLSIARMCVVVHTKEFSPIHLIPVHFCRVSFSEVAKSPGFDALRRHLCLFYRFIHAFTAQDNCIILLFSTKCFLL